MSPGALVLAAAIPILFLHVHYQPGFGIGFGSTTLNAYLSDFAVLAVVAVAVWSGFRDGFGPLARGRWLWLAAGLFLVWMFVEVAYGRWHSAAYPWHTHGVTAAKFAEYALLAPALPLLIRRTRDLVLPLWSLAVWSALATIVGLAQFLGAEIFLAGTVGRRQASFLSSADFAALSGAALLVGIVAIAVPRLRLGRALAVVATVSGALGMILAGAIASVLGLATALVALFVVLVLRRELEPRRVAARRRERRDRPRRRDRHPRQRPRRVRPLPRSVARQAGVAPGEDPDVRAPDAARWIGYEIWRNHPLLGVGWEGSAEPANFQPYVAAAQRRSPTSRRVAFPSAAPDRRYGVQNVWLQALADLGVVGLALWVAVFAAAAWLAGADGGPGRRGDGARRPRSGPRLLVWLWTAQGYVAGIPLDALTWLGVRPRGDDCRSDE